jgi:uncharacterized protein YecT (DUF1311 family)
MLRRYLAALLLAGTLAGPAIAEDDPIDVQLGACLDSPDGMSTQGMVECIGAAYEAWDKALNDAYRALMASLSPEEAELLRASQREWIKFRDAESTFLASLLTPDRGTMMRLTVNEMMSDLVKHRVLQLRSLADDDAG